METDQLIAVESSDACAPTDGKEGLECHHYRIKNSLCFDSHGSSKWPCKGQNIVLVNKVEYATWKTDAMTIRIRPVGERFAHPIHGELVVVRHTGCDGCVFRTDDCTAFDSDRRTVAGWCSLRGDDIAVVFAKPNDYVVFKLTGEWP